MYVATDTGQQWITNGTTWLAIPGSGGAPAGPAGGDLSGLYPNPTVAKIDGASVPAAGSLVIGNGLYVTGTSALGYSALNVAGGSNFITGTLPVGNGGTGLTAAGTNGEVLETVLGAPAWALVNLASSATVTGITGVANGGTGLGSIGPNGDVLTAVGGVPAWAVPATPSGIAPGTAAQILDTNSGATASQWVTVSGDSSLTASGVWTNAKINGTSVPAGGALTTGNACYVSGVSACTYSALNVGGGAGFVSGILPQANGGTGISSTGKQYSILQEGASTPAWVGAPGTPGFAPSWYAATDIYWDPAGTVSGSDSNSCTTSGAPCLTWSEIVRRYGSDRPTYNYGQTVTYHQLTAQPANNDPVFLAAKLSGGGQSVLVGTPIVAASSFTAGTVTQPSRTAGGHILTIASMPGGAAAADLVFNSTRGSYAFIDSMSGSTASIQQPYKSAALTTPASGNNPVTDDTWATGDTLVVYSLPTINLKQWRPVGGDFSSISQSVGWVQMVEIVDPSGTGNSVYVHAADGVATNVLSLDRIDARLHTASTAGRSAQAGVFGCTMVGGGNAIGGGAHSDIFGGGFLNGIQAYSSVYIENTVLHGTVLTEVAGVQFGRVNPDGIFSDGLFEVYGGGGSINLNDVLYGSFEVAVYPGGVFWKLASSSWASNLLTSGVLSLGGPRQALHTIRITDSIKAECRSHRPTWIRTARCSIRALAHATQALRDRQAPGAWRPIPSL